MDADASTANGDDSRKGLAARLAALPVVSTGALRVAGTLVVLAGCLALVVSTWMTVAQTKVLTTSDLAVDVDTTRTGWDLHGPAMLLVALFALVMLAGALRGARPAMVALLAAGVAAVVITGAIDSGKLDDTGSLALQYEDVSSGAETGFYVETLGAVLLLVGGGVLLGLGLPGAARLGAGVAGAASKEPARARLTPEPEASSPPASDVLARSRTADAARRLGGTLGAAAEKARAARERRAADRAEAASEQPAKPAPASSAGDPPPPERARSVRDRMR